MEPSVEAVKAVMLQAHVAWAMRNLDAARFDRLRQALAPDARLLVDRPVLATEWVPYLALVEIDKAIAAAAGGAPEATYRALGRHSAVMNLQGVYKSFVREEPHRFFEQTAMLHRRFQNFGESKYEQTGMQSGRLRIEGYQNPSPVFCASGRGYYEGALEMLKVPGPIVCTEVLCQCSGDPACLFDLSW